MLMVNFVLRGNLRVSYYVRVDYALLNFLTSPINSSIRPDSTRDIFGGKIATPLWECGSSMLTQSLQNPFEYMGTLYASFGLFDYWLTT